MDFSQLQPHLASHGLQPVYLIQGQESFLKGEALRLVREKASSDDPGRTGDKEAAAQGSGRRYETTELDAAESEPRKLFENLRTPSLFAPRRLVVVDNAELLADRAFDLLLEYVERPSSRTILALVQGEPRKPKRKPVPRNGEGEEKKPGKAKPGPSAREKERFLRKVAVVDCRILPERFLPDWCVAQAGAQGKRMDKDAAKLLVELVGASLGQLDGHIRSLAAFCKERQRISREDVLKLVGGDRARQFWELTNAITARSAPVALRALDRLMRDVESPGWLIGPLGREFRRLIKVKELSDQHLPLAEIAQRAGMPSWLAGKLLGAISGVSAEELKANLRLVLEADMDCKTGGGRDSWILERLVLKLCGVHAPAARV